ncbi:Ig-like domain-containing protein [candidate division KSB1 bacterium]|nr:Ig-like domain-containing protein [candidate division KSB1 bacterium]
MYKKNFFPLLFILTLAGSMVFAQNPPTHSRVLYQDDLKSAGTKDIGVVTNTQGSFGSGLGWQTTGTGSQLKINVKQYLPFEGTLQVKVRNLDPVTQVTNDWTMISIWSREAARYREFENTAGSFIFIKAEKNSTLISGGKAGFKTVYTSFNDSDKRYDQLTNLIAWDKAKEYTFQFIWSPKKMWFRVYDGATLLLSVTDDSQKPFKDQIENFQYIYLGRSNDYSAMAGPIFTDLKILVPESFIRFENATKTTGVAADGIFGEQAVSVTDINTDGLDDIYVNYYDTDNPKSNLLFVNNASHTFSDQAVASGLDFADNSIASLFADFDGDGHQDVFMSRDLLPNKLYINNGSGVYSDQSASRGIGTDNKRTVNALALDIENDGDLDIFVANNSDAHVLYVNNGSGQFTAESRGADSPTGAVARAIAGDVNLDGYVDIYLIRYDAPCGLLINNGSGNFSNEATVRNAHVSPSGVKANNATFVDYDNDGDLDIFFAISSTSTTLNPRIVVLENLGNGYFSNSSDAVNIEIESYGIIPGDVDNDGFQDLYFIKSNRRDAVPDHSSRIYRNMGNGSFTELTGTGAEAIYSDGRSGIFLDYDMDGQLDLYGVAKGNNWNGNKQTLTTLNFGRNHLLKNQTISTNNYIKVAVKDIDDNLNGIGAKIWVYEAGKAGQANYLLGYRDIYTVLGYGCQESLVQHFGVGTNTLVDIVVQMPGESPKPPYTNIPVNQLFEVNPLLVIPHHITVTGNSQTGKAGQNLINPISVQVYDENNNPAPGTEVKFQITAGNGHLDGDTETQKTIVSDNNGRAQVFWKMGTTAGLTNTLVITAQYSGSHLQGSPNTISITPGPNNPAKIVNHAGNGQTGYIMQFLTNPIIAKVTDEFNNVIADHPVVFTVISGNGSIEQAGTTTLQVQTDSQGLAEVNWLLGDLIGTQMLNATASFNSSPLQNSPLQFTATAEPPQKKLLYQSGNYQKKQINSQLDQFKVKLVDYNNIPQTGQTVQFTVISDSGSFGGQKSINAQTDQQGIASATAKLASVAGDTIYVFHAVYPGASGSPYVFKASATPGPAVKMTQVAGANNQVGPVARTLPIPFKVRVLDIYNNPVQNHSVDFTVTKGGGSIENTTFVTKITDKNGYAAVSLKLGEQVGENIVIASANGLTGSPITFFATGIHGAAARMDIFSGKEQSGSPGMTLSLPFVVVVRDSFYNPVNGHDVVFIVTEGGGNIEGQSQVTKQTNDLGRASVYMTLGPTAFINKVQASGINNGLPLINSPLEFIATTGPGDPKKIVYIDGDQQIGRINEPLPKPFKVKVTDENGIPINGHEVEFISFTPGAHFSGENNIVKRTDKDGYAAATATLGSNFQDYEFEAVAKFNNQPLSNCPIQFTAYGRKSTATKITNISEPVLTGTAGRVMADSLKIKVEDNSGNPVTNHPVSFEITSQAGSLLNGNWSHLTVNSDQFGIARVSVKLRKTPGKVYAKAFSDNGLPDGELQGSPVNFVMTALTGPPDPATSIMTSVDNVLANGTDKSDISITLKDSFNNPVSGKIVRLETAGIEVNKTQPADTTDSNGSTTGFITSVNVGQVIVWALVENQLIHKDTINFITGPPATANIINPGQYAVVGKQLANPVGVQVRDSNDHPVKDIDVTFTVVDGNGSLVEQQPVSTNDEGKALVHWKLGPVVGIQHLSAKVDGITDPFEITAIATAPSLAEIEKVAGDSLIGLINENYNFTVSVIDTLDIPIVNFDVDFELVLGTGDGQGVFTTPATVPTDENGLAAVTFKAGTLTGLHKIKATAGEYGFVIFDFIVETARSVTLTKVLGDGQTVRPNTDIDLVIRAVNAFGQPVYMEKIKFEITQGPGLLDKSQPVTTDALGLAQTRWTVGNLTRTHQVKVSPVEAVGTPVTFTAIVENSAPVFDQVPEHVSIIWDNSYSTTISATDPDEDPVNYGARDLPFNADFDSTGTQLFSWQPVASQEGEHLITFIATDPYGAADTTHMLITVIVENRCPVITHFEPADTNSIPVSQEDYNVHFKISAMDPDNDPLSYEWRVNDIYNGDDSTLTIPFKKEFFPDPNITVQVIVSDGSCEKRIRWSVLLTAVELNNFEAVSGKNGIEIKWQTKSETNNIGFNILKSIRESGPYEKINNILITPSSDGNYSYQDLISKAGIKYYYKLQDIDINGFITEHGPVLAEIPLPDKISLSQNYPNPFNPTTTISFELPAPDYVQIYIFNSNGQLVRILADGQFEPGYFKLVWDARNEQGTHVPSGIYFYRMKVKEFIETKKLLLLK